MPNAYWETRLTKTSPDGIWIRGYDLLELIGRMPYPSVLYLLFKGDLPEPKVARLIDACMVACIDHGAGAPSALAARTATSGGASLGAAGAAGLLTLGQYHGAVIDDSVTAMHRVVELHQADGSTGSLSNSAELVVAEWRREGRRISGFGHRQHKERDPRVERLFALAREADVSGRFVQAAFALERALESALGKPLPLNIDGATAAIFCEIDFPPELANAVFMVARLAGILAHAQEEKITMPPMRRIDPVEHGYSGPANRHLELDP